MHNDQIRKIAMRLSGEEMGHLRQMQLHGTEDVRDFGGAPAILKSLEVHDLVFRTGSTVSLTHRGKLVARSL